MRRIARHAAIALLVTLAACTGNHEPGPAPREPARPAEVNMPPDATPLDRLVADATARILAGAAAGESCAILLSTGPGDAAAGASAKLRAALEKDPRVQFTKSEKRPAGPVADPSALGGHVDTVEWTFTPPPRLVVRVFELSGKLSIAAREPGADPLGPPVSGWLWQISAP